MGIGDILVGNIHTVVLRSAIDRQGLSMDRRTMRVDAYRRRKI